MLLELATSLLITYAGSEYLHGSRSRSIFAVLAVAALQAASLIVWPAGLPTLLLTFKVPIVAFCYVLALYLDTVVRCQLLSHSDFGWALLDALRRLVPMFPMLSLLIAFGFLELGEVMEHVGLPTIWLNAPIYYGCLYGPFACIYMRVKAVAKLSSPLPRTL
mmetsp:Transcript_47490/g.78593  ORF Transcript_47490/g.78593 Transcript_47490/m.78593 type:complete len:162 (-) Transcript_47490:279-764(-)